MKHLLGLLAIVAAFAFSGCATITRGTHDTLVIESDPVGANVRLSTGLTGKTPTAFKLSRRDSLTVWIEKPNYEPVEVNVCSQVSGGGGLGMAGNVVFGGLIGIAVDGCSGSMNDLKPNPIKVTLVPLKQEAPAPKPVEAPATEEKKNIVPPVINSETEKPAVTVG